MKPELSNLSVQETGEIVHKNKHKVDGLRWVIPTSEKTVFYESTLEEQNLLIDSYLFAQKLYFVGK